MKQLTSPPISARALASWLIENFQNDTKPLGTIQLLISEPGDICEFESPANGISTAVESANLDNIEEALNHWIDLADMDLDNQVIFYFCGHGMSKGASMVLLPEDFGRANNAFRHAIDLMNIYDALDQYQAQQQVFFVDACRTPSEEYNFNNGQPLLQVRERSAEGTRSAPIYFSTIAGEYSHGRPNSVSLFTNALLDCLSDFGADRNDGRWNVTNIGLLTGIDHLLTYYTEAEIGYVVQVPDTVEVRGRFTIHSPQQIPKAIMYVVGDPEVVFQGSKIVCEDDTNRQISEPNGDDSYERIFFNVTSGSFRLEAKDENDLLLGQLEDHIQPPYMRFIMDLNS